MKGTTALFCLLGLLSWAADTEGLKCYTCVPSISSLGCDTPYECTAGSEYCLTIQTDGHVSHTCSPTCVNHPSTTCCQTDGCNAPTISPGNYAPTGLKCHSCVVSSVTPVSCDVPVVCPPGFDKYCLAVQSHGFTAYSCGLVCPDNSTTSCCQTDGCNAPTDLPPGPTGDDPPPDDSPSGDNPSAGSTGLKCYTCYPAFSTFGCDTPRACVPGIDKYCMTVKSNGFISHSCALTCSDDSSTTCCQTDGCNAPTDLLPGPTGNNPPVNNPPPGSTGNNPSGSSGLKCYTCYPAFTTIGCDTPSACEPGIDKYCMTVSSNGFVYHSCASTCSDDSSTTCCQTDGCNAPTYLLPGPTGNNPSGSSGLKCYLCVPSVTTHGCNTPIACPSGTDKYCVTVRSGNGFNVGTCSASCPDHPVISCCQTDGCNALTLGSKGRNSASKGRNSASSLAVSGLIRVMLLAIGLFF